MNRHYSLFVRLFLVFAWLVAIFLFLFFPLVNNLWHTKQSISIMTWADLIDTDLIEQFEQETGIKVYVSYIESNEELYARFRATGGKGQDLILPSDFTIQLLVKDDLLKPLDKSKLPLFERLDERLLHLYYDPQNTYAIPFYWALYGIGYNKRIFTDGLPATWKVIFTPAWLQGAQLVMPETAREVVLAAAYYLFGSIDNLDQKKFEEIQTLLLHQKSFVGVYSETRADYLLGAQEFPLAVIPTTIIWRGLKEHPYLEFMMPQETALVMIDNFAIPKLSTKEELVYQFLNFMYRPENIRITFERHRFFPATVDLIPLLEEYGSASSIINAHSSDPSSWSFFKNIPERNLMEDVWVALKAE